MPAFDDKMPSRAGIRRLLDRVLPTDADLEALCIDFFPDVAHCLSRGMDRKSKVNLLFMYHETTNILDALRAAHPGKSAQHFSALDPVDESPEAQEAQARSQLIKKLGLERATRLRRGQDTRELDQEIASNRREQRQGPQLHESEELSGRYYLMELIGRGGFANVWLLRFSPPA